MNSEKKTQYPIEERIFDLCYVARTIEAFSVELKELNPKNDDLQGAAIRSLFLLHAVVEGFKSPAVEKRIQREIDKRPHGYQSEIETLEMLSSFSTTEPAM